MSEHECRCAGCTSVKKAGAEAGFERIIELFKSELVRMEKESPSGAYYHNGAGMKMAIELLEGTYEDDWVYEEDGE